MVYLVAANAVLLTHLAYIAFVLAGGLLVLRWRKVAFVHVPAVLWAIFVELSGWVCPLTPLENWLRRAGGEQGYHGGFVAHYLLAIIYPAGLTRPVQWGLGLGVLLLNVVFYVLVWRRRRH